MPDAPLDVLLVEHDPELREAIALILRGAGYATATAGWGEQALSMLATERPGVILLDLGISKSTASADLCATLAASPALRSIPVVIVTGLARADAAARCPTARAFLRKPCSAEALLATVARHCGPASPPDGRPER